MLLSIPLLQRVFFLSFEIVWVVIASALQFLWLNFPRHHYSLSLESNSFFVLEKNKNKKIISAGGMKLFCLVVWFLSFLVSQTFFYQMVLQTGS